MRLPLCAGAHQCQRRYRLGCAAGRSSRPGRAAGSAPCSPAQPARSRPPRPPVRPPGPHQPRASCAGPPACQVSLPAPPAGSGGLQPRRFCSGPQVGAEPFVTCGSHLPTGRRPPAAPRGAGTCSARQGAAGTAVPEQKWPQFPPQPPRRRGSRAFLAELAPPCSASAPVRTARSPREPAPAAARVPL